MKLVKPLCLPGRTPRSDINSIFLASSIGCSNINPDVATIAQLLEIKKALLDAIVAMETYYKVVKVIVGARAMSLDIVQKVHAAATVVAAKPTLRNQELTDAVAEILSVYERYNHTLKKHGHRGH